MDAIGGLANLCFKPGMGFMQLLKSLDDLLYEVMSWLVFYPITLWRTVRHPASMMAYADAELQDSPGQQYTDTLQPPVFLLLTLILSHLIELTVLGQSKLVTDKTGIAGMITDDTTLLLLRLLVFSVFPMILAVRLVRKQKVSLTRDSLRQPFYSQCYPTGPFALMIGVGSIGTQLHWPQVQLGGGMLILLALLWYGSLQARWFARELGVSMLHGLWIASIGMVECLVVIVLVAPLLT